MSELNLQPTPPSGPNGDKQFAVPTLWAVSPPATQLRAGGSGRSMTRRYSATRLMRMDDQGFRPFRVY